MPSPSTARPPARLRPTDDAIQPVLRLHTIGRCLAECRSQTVGPRAETVFASLLYLGVEADRRVSRTQFGSLLWPDAPEGKRSQSVRGLLAALRKLGLPLVAAADHLTVPAETIDADFHHLDALVSDAVGPILPGYNPTFSAPFAAWVREQRDLLTANVLRHLGRRLATAQAAHDWELVDVVARAIRRVDPQNEEGTLALAESQCYLGAKAKGLALIDEYTESIGTDREVLRLPAELLRRRIAGKGTQAVARRAIEAPFIGRQDHLRAIDSMLYAAREARGGSLLFVGPPGIGKTRLLDESATRAALAGMQVLTVRCPRHDSIRPLSTVAELVSQLLTMRGAAGCDPGNLQHLRRLAQLGEKASEFSESSESKGSAATDLLDASPELRRARVTTAVLDLLSAASDEAPILLILDDCQWADEAFPELWTSMSSWSATHAVAWLFASRPLDGRAFLGGLTGVAVAEVGALDPTSARAILGALMIERAKEPAREVIDALLARGAGNPLLLHDLTREWSATGRADTLPSSIASLFSAQFARLSPTALRTLQAAGVLGTLATVGRIEEILPMPREALLDALTELDRAGILTTDDQGIAYGHVLWADAALAELPRSAALLLHRHAAQRLDVELAATPSLTLLWESARHWEAAGDRQRAGAAIRRGAEHLAESGFLADAAEAYRTLLTYPTIGAEELDLLRRRIELLRGAARWNEVKLEIDRYDRRAIELDPSYDRHNDLELLGLHCYYMQTGDLLTVLAETLKCVRDVHAQPSHRLAAARLCAGVVDLVDRPLLQELQDFASACAPRTEEDERCRLFIERQYHMCLGDVRRVCPLLDERLAVVRRSGDPRLLCDTLDGAETYYSVGGRVQDAKAAAMEMIALARRHGFLDALVVGYERLISHNLDFDSTDAARHVIEEAREFMKSIGVSAPSLASHVFFPTHEAELATREGRHRDALDHAPSLERCLEHQPARWRARFLAVHLSARMGLGQFTMADEVAGHLSLCFEHSNHWMDWPATIYARYLRGHDGEPHAAAFAARYITTIRRELYPPPAHLSALASTICAT